MRVLLALLLILLLRLAEPRRRSGAGEGPAGGRVRGRGRAAVNRRQTPQCDEYEEAGEKYLDCQDRQLTTVMQDWPTDIHHLLLARNKIQVLRDNMFSQFTQLKSLDLQQNDISMVEERAFSGLSQLTSLLLQHNGLKTTSEEVLLPLPRLTYLRIYDNPWHCQCSLDSLIRTIQVPSRRNLGNYAKCAEPLSLKGQKLKKINVDSLCVDSRPGGGGQSGQGEQGGGGRPKPTTRPKMDATSMCHTYMFPRPVLDCGLKDLKSIPSDLPSDIVKMDLSRNTIRHLRPKQFLLSKDLKLLNLSSNSLQKIDTAAFAGLLYLRELDMSNNSLQYFQYGVLEDLYFLRKLSLDRNPWTCDYNIHYLVYWLKHHPGVAYSGLVCAEPAEFRGWRVEDYVKTYNGECPKDKQVDLEAGPGTQGQGENEAQEVVGETEGQGRLPRPIQEKPNRIEIIRLN
ncbi:leucine-rich repeat-containing protein 17 [Eucyclogobius newberryi]|uniref:leucine-rich repeat-containing protein 17 n=1 Tax=Eucyclogobius newberryi TaxID=166745 RepID=UPI003B5BCFA5